MAILKGKIKTETGDILYPETSVDKVIGIDEAPVKVLDYSMSKVSGVSDGLALPSKSQMEMLSLRGNTIAWNQLAKPFNSSNWNSSVTTYNNGVMTFASGIIYNAATQQTTLVSGHKYLVYFRAKNNTNTNPNGLTFYLGDSSRVGAEGVYTSLPSTLGSSWQEISVIGTYTQHGSGQLIGFMLLTSGIDVNVDIKDLMVIDLTTAYPTDTPTTLTDPDVQWCINYALKHPEFASKLVNVGLTAYETTGRNLFDVSKAIDGITILANDGSTDSDPNLCSSDYIPVQGNAMYSNNITQQYYVTSGLAFYDASKNYIGGLVNNSSLYRSFLTPSNARYVRLTMLLSEKNGVMLNAGSTALPYEPYVKHTYPLLWNGKSAGSVYDEKLADGKEITRVKQFVINAENLVTFGTSGGSNVNYAKTNIVISDALYNWDNQIGISSIGYVVKTLSDYWAASFIIGISTDGTVNIGNNNFTTLDQFKALCPIVVNYQLVTPIETDGDPLPNAIAVYQGGTEWQINDGAPCGIYKDYDISIKDQVLTNVKVDARQEEEIEELKQADYKSLYNLGEYDSVDTSNKDYDLVTRATGVVDLGTLNWIYDPSNNQFYSNIIDSAKNGSGVSVSCPLYDFDAREYVQYQNPHTRGFYDKRLYIVDENYANNVSGLIVHLQDVYVQYQLETPYTEKVIKNRPLDTLDQNGSMFVRKEWEKGLNLFDYESRKVGYGLIWDTGEIYANENYWTSDYIPVEPNKTYSISGNDYNGVSFYDSSKSFISGSVGITSGSTFTTPSNARFVRIASTISITQVMLNEGSHPYPYQPYNGAIVREKDVNGTLLWENGNPDASFAGQTVTIANSSKFKYLVVSYGITPFSGSNYAKMLNEVNLNADSGALSIVIDVTVGRSIQILSSTSVSFSDAYRNGVGNNERAIPFAIYGTNVL